MALLGLLGLILFLMGKYSTGLARLQGQRLLRPGAAYLLLTAYACFLSHGQRGGGGGGGISRRRTCMWRVSCASSSG